MAANVDDTNSSMHKSVSYMSDSVHEKDGERRQPHRPALGDVIEAEELEGEGLDDNAKALQGQKLDFTPEEGERFVFPMLRRAF